MALPSSSSPSSSSDLFHRRILESVQGRDERFQIDPMTSPPYKWICFLTIESAIGETYFGSGFKIHFPVDGLNCAAIVTSGHCTYVDKEYATKITVKFPGEDPVEVTDQKDLYAAPEYVQSGFADHDYGLIALRGAPNTGSGWTTSIYQQLNNRLVTNCGYPGDKVRGTLWITGGEITHYTANTISYMNDTMGGQSGSPVYTWHDGYWTVVGVHSYGGPPGFPNSATRFTRQMISRFAVFLKGQLQPNNIPFTALPIM